MGILLVISHVTTIFALAVFKEAMMIFTGAMIVRIVTKHMMMTLIDE
jgi:hypothetical protein